MILMISTMAKKKKKKKQSSRYELQKNISQSLINVVLVNITCENYSDIDLNFITEMILIFVSW